jgi:hypothetical protein
MLLNDLEAYIKFPGQFPIAKIKFSYLGLPQLNPIYLPKPKKEVIEDIKTSKSEDISEDRQDEIKIIQPNVIHAHFGDKTKNEPLKNEQEMETSALTENVSKEDERGSGEMFSLE